MSKEEVTSAGMWFTTRGIWMWYTCVYLGHGSGAFNDQTPLLDLVGPYAFFESKPLDPQNCGKWVMATLGKIPPTSHPQLLPGPGKLTSHANPDPVGHVSFGTASRLNWHIFPPVCWGDSLSVHSTFSLSWLPAVAIGSLILSSEQLSTPVVMRSLELMCNCVQSPAEKQKTLFTVRLKAGDPSHLPEHQTWILTTFYLLLLISPIYGLLMASQGLETSQTAKTWKCLYDQEIKGKCIPFIWVLRWEKKAFYIWKYEPFSPLCYPQHLCVVWSALSGACIST